MSTLVFENQDGPLGTVASAGASGELVFDTDGAPEVLSLPTSGTGALVGNLIPGPAGEDGSDGAPGPSAYAVAVTNGFVGSQAEWLASLKGSKGDQGNSVSLQKTSTAIQWKPDGGSWVDLVLLAALMGADGKSVELQKTATAIQWRQAGGSWTDLVLLADLKGPQGNIGATGPAGPGFLVLNAADSVPGGTPTNTIIVRI